MDEWVCDGEILFRAEFVGVSELACVATALEGEQGVQFVVMLAPEFFGFGFALLGFEQESLLDDLDGIRTGELQVDGEAAFDLGEVQSLADRTDTDHGVDVFL